MYLTGVIVTVTDVAYYIVSKITCRFVFYDVFHKNQDYKEFDSDVKPTAIPIDDQQFSAFCDTQ
jgi:hypothetical protein